MKNKIATIKLALKCRKTEERLLELFKEGHLSGTVHTSIGQEIIPAIIHNYTNSDDYKISNHRGHSHYLCATGDYDGLIKELLGRVGGCSGGYGGSQHLYNGDYNFYSNGIQGGMAPVAAGIALGLKNENKKRIVCIYIGDGTLGQGVLYEAINICGIFDLPVLFICEDNGVAQSTMTSAFKLDALEKRMEGFSCVYKFANSDDWDELDKIVCESIGIVRGNKPVFLRVKTRRLMSHSKGDDNRPDELILENQNADPLNNLLKTDLEMSEYSKKIDVELDAIVRDSLSSEILKEAVRYKYVKIEEYSLTKHISCDLNLRQKIYYELERMLSRSGFILGEDVRNKNGAYTKNYGGAFKVTSDLSEKYPLNVINTPIAEQALIGLSCGLALMGHESSVEIMFGDFMTLTLDQIYQHISKFSVMFGCVVGMPLLIRSPMGGRRGYGPTHSQSIERLFLGIPGVRVLFANKYSPIKEVLSDGFKNKIPQILFEHKLNYSSVDKNQIEATHDIYITSDISKTVIASPKYVAPKLTLFTYGYGLDLVESVLKEVGDQVEIVCPTVLSPLNILPLVKSLAKTERLFVLEEGFELFGLSAAIVLELKKSNIKFELIGAEGNGSVIPSASEAELRLLNNGIEKLKEYIKNVSN